MLRNKTSSAYSMNPIRDMKFRSLVMIKNSIMEYTAEAHGAVHQDLGSAVFLDKKTEARPEGSDAFGV